MVNDLISRSALLEELSSLTMTVTGLRAGRGVLNEFMTEYRNSVLRIVDNAPTIDPESLRAKGRWHLLDECSNAGVYCSVCNKKVYKEQYANQKLKSPYCPNCGAKMEV